ncbi:thioredoxin 1 [Pseudomonas sp. JUb42]|jgi:thioredoxin 1|uniref:thioredoxin family protein n=1 Tax=Pseudomonas sp. JUb42 TaxID=2940611 RepID=UPI00216AAF44|nr:thioredoxin family protein [Pseudomonas sp. JUb42]MCS3472088.1 thioredoxin 1 [Pseudomonas sp. JUb42]
MSLLPYVEAAPSREEVDALSGPTLIEFGTNWCGHCKAAQPLLEQVISGFPGVRHIRVEDGSGRRLGRSYGVKLWPTMIFLTDGQEVDRLVRPTENGQIAEVFDKWLGQEKKGL